MGNTDGLILALLIPILIWIGGVALTVLVLWMTIRSAVRKALWDHHERVENEAHVRRGPTTF